MSKSEIMLVRVIIRRMAQGESLGDILASYKNLSDEARERVLGYVEHN